ncbi:DUF1266 domain-containing protein [Nocardioides daejeonensis]|uniref:DUF1266 domain-containing protein n=1 Tax=Nocardioides daejeonensis TaxID=1046556 RepID=UPI0013A53D3C|nr:DUF1266 domain-containing protein [Nocardioides daejeonensis]
MLGHDSMLAAEEPLGERLGPFIFWPLLVLLLGVLVWALAKRSRQGGRARTAGQGTDWTRPEAYAEHHRVVWSQDPESFTPGPLHWPLAVAAVFGVCSGDPWDELAFRNLDNPREGLTEAWGIRSRPQLLSRLHWILREGHRVDLAEEVAEWSSLDQQTATRLLQESRSQGSEEARERAWRLEQVWVDARGLREVRFEAWDLVRAAMLTRAGYSLGWLTEPEAVDTLHLISAELRHTFTSWEELGDHFLRARWYWASNSDAASRQEDAHDASRQSALLDPARGPWAYVPWAQPIPDSRAMIADAMVADELLVEVPPYSPTRLAEVIDGVTAERLADRP